MILLAAIAANLPFMNQKLFACIPLKHAVKPVWVRLSELLVLYAVTGMIAYALEARIGNVFTQRWEFYAVTLCLFIVLSFPGFVYRYLHRRHG